MQTRVDDPVADADIWHTLGATQQNLGQYLQAEQSFHRAHALYRLIGDRYHEAGTLESLGDNHNAMGDLASAGKLWRQALAIFDEIAHRDTDKALAKLATKPMPGRCLVAPG